MTYFLYFCVTKSIPMKRCFSSIFLFITIGSSVFCQKLLNGNSNDMRKFSFKSISVNEGLSQFAITSILQDGNGFMWMGTYDGLNRYDGFNVTAMRHIYNNPTSLINNRILALAIKSKKELWIGSQDGLISYDNASQQFRSIPEATKDLNSPRINTLFIDHYGNLWIGTEKGVSVGYLQKNETYSYVAYNYFKNMYITNFCEDRNGSIWMTTSNGAYIIDKKNVGISIRLLKGTSNVNMCMVYNDKNNRIWLGGDDYFSVVKKEAKNYSIKRLEKQLHGKGELNVRSFAEDTVNSGFWVGTWKQALINFEIDRQENVSKKTEYNTNSGLEDNDISTLYIDKSNVLWAGTRNGISYTDLSPKKFQHLQLFENTAGTLGLKKKYINSLFVDSDNKLWINIYQMGLFVYDLKTKNISDATRRVTPNSIMEIMEDRKGNLWFGSFDGIYRLPKSERNNPASKAEKINTGVLNNLLNLNATIIEDKYGKMWFSINRCLLRYFPEKKSYIEYTEKDGLPYTQGSYQIFYTPNSDFIWIYSIHSGISKIYFNKDNDQLRIESFASNANMANRFVWQLFVDKNNTLWVGSDTGLDKIKLNSENNEVEHFDNPAIRNSKVSFIVNDKFDNLWIGSSQGLYSIDIKTNEVQRYTHEDGLQSNSFTDAFAKTKDGIIFVGGINGINYFNPQKITENKFPSYNVFTAFRIHNKDVTINEKLFGNIMLKQDINFTERIKLNYKQNNFTLEFAALHFAASKRNLYRYKLEGYDHDWIEVDANHRFASYSNLPAGTYKFKLLTSNNDHVWTNTPKELTITILPPPWKTFWAYALYVLIIGVILFFILKYIYDKQVWRNKLLIQQLEKQKEHEMNEMKLSFFTNITHELRTPLVLILGPLRDLINWGNVHEEFVSYRLNIINKNANRLLDLINQILNVRSMSANHLPLSISVCDMEALVNNIVNSFDFYSEKEGITLSFACDGNLKEAWIDKDKIEKVLHNLISNAMKYTPRGGNVDVRLWLYTDAFSMQRKAFVSVKDNGVGIEKNRINKIFDMFYSSSSSGNGNSWGIGLSFSKILVEAHLGKIEVESQQGAGSIFTFFVPIDRDAYDAKIIRADKKEETPAPENKVEKTEERFENDSRYTVLVVEDNDDMRDYIRESLKNDFRIIEALDGEEGLTLARKHIPNAIISDLMMPKIDGISLIVRLKGDTRTNFIPVIVHSVKDDKNSIWEAFSAGAQDYIVKPFEPEILIRKINNLLSARKEYAKKLQTDQIITPTEVESVNPDVELLAKITNIVEQNLSNSDLNAFLLSSELGMSRMQLYRKLKNVSGGKQISELILDIRLKRAAQLFLLGDKRINEVMYETGFNNNTRFKDYFKKMFGVTPAEFIKQNSINDKKDN